MLAFTTKSEELLQLGEHGGACASQVLHASRYNMTRGRCRNPRGMMTSVSRTGAAYLALRANTRGSGDVQARGLYLDQRKWYSPIRDVAASEPARQSRG